MKRDEPIDLNWLRDAVREFDQEMKRKPKWTGYSPFHPSNCIAKPSTTKGKE